jgi:LPXTG-site transpeptidase (sortase) family protein
MIVILCLTAVASPWKVTTAYADKLVCAVPGKDGPASIGGIVNTYYPGSANVSAGATSIPVGAPLGAATPIQPGDLLLVIQMQGADINSTNTGAYGDGTAGDPATGILGTNFSAGQYEYVVATSAVVAGSVSISSGLVNSYFDQDYPVGASNQGQRRFQVIRVPQYSSATITSAITSLPWNGSVGGVVALDIAGTLNMNGNSINVSGQGFRGGGGVEYDGDGAGTTFSRTDYRTPSTSPLNASKGEGIAGTPRFVFNGTSVVDLGIEGYPDGSFARGAPGNAGGGGTDGDPIGNEENTGGGGGGNGGAGGIGGWGWANTGSTISESGGFGGSAFPATASRLVMGGGGGAGTINNNNPLFSSGGIGGGIVMVRAGTISDSGTISADGADGQDQPLNDSGGGGGAGGSVLVVAQSNLPAGLNVSAQGGDGGDAWPGQSNTGWDSPSIWRHGPGAGGGGGVIFLNSAAGTLSVAGGVNGVTTTDSDIYGSNPGSLGILDTATSPASIATGISGAECIPTPAVVKTTGTPVVSQTPTGTTGEYTIVVSIPANQGTALGFSISDSLPTGFTYAATTSVTPSGGAVRVSTVNPTVGTSTPSWGTFDIPGGGQVTITFTVNIASSVPAGVYQNPATATYTDPTRTVTTGTTTTEYDPASSTGEDIEVITATLPDLTVTKTNNVNDAVQPNSPFTWTITVSNIGTGGAAFTSGQTILNDALPGVAGYYPQGALTVTNGATPPTGTINCSISGTTLSCVASGVVTLTADASFGITFTVTPTAGGELVNTAVVDPNGVITESNENNNQDADTVSVLGADLSIVKDNGQTSYLAGSVVTYTVTVSNLAGVSITGATVSDPRPANIATWAWACTNELGGATGCTPSANSASDFTDTVNLPVGGSIIYTVTATVVATPTGDLVNTATVSVPTGYTDTNPGNNSSTDTDTLTLSSVDLAITKDDGQAGYTAGGTVTYTVTVTNLSGTDVTGATISDPRPANIATWAWACTSETGGASGCTPAGNSANNFTDTVNLPVGGEIVYTVTANVVANPTGSLVNTATVTPPSGFADSDTSNNSSTDINTLLTADLSIIKTDGQVTFAGDDTLTYTVTVTNLSGVTVTGAVIADTIPANILSWTWVCMTEGGGATGCDGAASNSADFTDTVNLPVSGTIVYTVTAVVVSNPVGDLANTATVSLPPGITDSNPGNNTSTDTNFQGEVADLSLNKSASNLTPAPLTNITFTLALLNIGPDPATGVVVTENIPSGFTFVSAVASQGTYSNVTSLWNVGDLAVNATATLTITVTVNLAGSYANTAQVSASDQIDPDSTPANSVTSEDDQDSVTITPNFGSGGGSTPGQASTPITGFLIPVTGFTPNVVTELSVASRPVYAPSSLRIEIPVLNVKTSIVGVEFKDGNWDVSWLQDQAGWLNGTAYPTWRGNSLITAHAVNSDGRPGVFSGLNHLAAGEYVFVYNNGYRYTYRVESNDLTQATDFDVLKHEEKPYLTLITCDTYDEKSGMYLLRVVVRAVLVDVREVK